MKHCDPVPVVRNVMIPWNPDSETITFTTDSVIGSIKREARVLFYGIRGKNDKNGAGAVNIRFHTDIEYDIGACKNWTPFPVTLPAETHKTWTITYNYVRKKRVVIQCNGVQVLNVVLSKNLCIDNSYWKNYWKNKKPSQIEFAHYDDASDSYCISRNPGK